MPFHFEGHPDERRCTLRLSGVVTAADLKEMIDTQIAERAWTWDALIDTTEATDMTLAFGEMLEQARFVGRRAGLLPPRGAVVILAPHPQAFGMARMYENATQGERSFALTVVATRAEAETILAATPSAVRGATEGRDP